MEAATASGGSVTVKRRKRTAGQEERNLARKMIAPSLILIAVVAAYPIVYAVWLSLHEYSVITPGLSRWAGLKNYTDAFDSKEFRDSIKNTFVFTVFSVFFELVLGLAMALIMHNATKGKGLLRTIVLIPWAVLTVVTAITWQTIFEPNLGLVNTVLRTLHLPGAETVWLGQKPQAMEVLIIADVWKTAPFMALLILAGLQVIPNDVYDAAKVDGANAWQRFRRITLPLLTPAIIVAMILRTLDELRIFDMPFVLTKGANGTNTLSFEAYQELRQNNLIGLGSAMSIITFLIVMAVSFLYIRFVGGNIRGLADEG